MVIPILIPIFGWKSVFENTSRDIVKQFDALETDPNVKPFAAILKFLGCCQKEYTDDLPQLLVFGFVFQNENIADLTQRTTLRSIRINDNAEIVIGTLKEWYAASFTVKTQYMTEVIGYFDDFGLTFLWQDYKRFEENGVTVWKKRVS